MKTRQEAQAIMQPEVERYPSTAKLHLSMKPLRPREFQLALGEMEPEDRPHLEGSWVGLLDLFPDARWAHPVRYLLVDPDGALRGFDARWFPDNWQNAFREGGQ